MNLQTTFSQTNPFPFRFGNSRTEEYSKPRQDYAKQRTQAFESQEVEQRQKDNSVLSREAVAIIGTNGKRRFDDFKGYPNGWYGGKGKELSKGSIFVFEQFIKYLPELKSVRPSLFLTLEGNLSLGWKDKNTESVEVEFYPDKMDYFIESLDKESSVKLANIFELTKKVKELL